MSAAGRSGSFSADGAFDFAGGKGVMTADVSSFGLPGTRGKTEMRVVGGVIYLDMGTIFADASPAEREALGGKRWMKLDVSDSGATGAAGASGLGSLGSSDPTSILEALRGSGADVHEVGHDTVRGVETTHYRAQIDLERALSRVPAAERARAAKSLQALGTGTVPADIWLDGQDRLRKLAMNLDTTMGKEQVGALTLELYDFGTPVVVQAPPAAETFDLQSMFRRRLDQIRRTDLHDLSSS